MILNELAVSHKQRHLAAVEVVCASTSQQNGSHHSLNMSGVAIQAHIA